MYLSMCVCVYVYVNVCLYLHAHVQEFAEFWPEKGESVEVDAGNFKLSMRDDPVLESSFTTREFILESIQVSHATPAEVCLLTSCSQLWAF